MNTRALFTFGMSALVLGGAMAGYAGVGSTAFADTRDADKMAARQFDKARDSLARGDAQAAVKAGETAVGYAPQIASYRVLLGQAYLKAGRFTSAHAAFADALSLEPGNGKAALHLALSEIAEGNWDAARRTLDANASTIAVADRGLAIALAGDPAAAVELLDSAARSPEADAKTRQNYALALALAGRWADAKTVVAIDLAPDQVDQRIMQWASFAKPASASDQVASLLGVTPVADPGQPAALALNGAGNTAVAAVAPADMAPPSAPLAVADARIAADMPVAAAAPVIADVPAVAATATTVAAAAPAPGVPAMALAADPLAGPISPELVAAAVSNVSFAPRQEVVQAVPPRAVATTPAMTPGAAVAAAQPKAAAKTAMVTPKPAPAAGAAPMAKGNFFVQLGAYENAAVARDAWTRAARVLPAFAGHSPSGMPVSTKAGNFYRLSVGGFTRADAAALCQGYKAKGGKCFVRAGAGDKATAWVKPGMKLASR